MRVELFGLGGRERSGSFWAVGGGPVALEDLVGRRYPTTAQSAGNMLASVVDWVRRRFLQGSYVSVTG